MKNSFFVLTAIIVCTAFAPLAFCSRSAIRPASVTATRLPTTSDSFGQSRYKRTGPGGTYSNVKRIVTFADDKFFLGTVPYGSVSEFQGRIGSNELKSFIRQSNNPSTYYRGNTFYLPSRVATSVREDVSGKTSRPQTVLTGEMDKYKPIDLSVRNPTETYYQKRPSLPNLRDLERRINRQPEFDKIREEFTEVADDYSMQKKPSGLDDILTSQPQKPAEPANVEGTYERLKKARQKRKEELFKRELMEEIAPVEIEQQDDEIGMFLEDNNQKSSVQAEAAEPGGLDEYNKAADMHAKALEIRGEHATFAHYSEAKFKNYIRAAQEFIKQGKYYLAADTYSLAEVYDLGNVEATIGMAHSLFAAGEYMSSAFMVRKVLRLQPEYAKETTHLGELLIDKDMVENRVIELERCVNVSKSSELTFLMAYILYRTDRPDTAMNFIDIAADGMSDSPAVLNLKAEIEKACKF